MVMIKLNFLLAPFLSTKTITITEFGWFSQMTFYSSSRHQVTSPNQRKKKITAKCHKVSYTLSTVHRDLDFNDLLF